MVYLDKDMENQINLNDQNSQQIRQYSSNLQVISTNKPSRRNYIVFSGIILVLVVIFGTGGYYLWNQSLTNFQQNNNNQSSSTATSAPNTSPHTPTPIASSSPAQDKLQTYTSELEKLSFQYPADWKQVPHNESNFPDGDSYKLQSPNGNLEVLWVAALDGLGGGCDETAVLGAPDACPLVTILEKQRIANADLYYVAYLKTHDGESFFPGMAVLDSTGPLTTQRTNGYMFFKGKFNGGRAAILEASPVIKNPFDESQAKAFLVSPEAKQAKDVLLSASY